MSQVSVSVKRLPHSEGLALPAYATPGSSASDLLAAVSAPVTLAPNERKIIPTGLCFAIPEGHEGQVRSRSGLTIKQGLVVANGVGTIDSDYRGELGVILHNISDVDVVIERGMRIAQFVIAPYTAAAWAEVNELPETARGEGGFGSTGVKSNAA